VLVELLELLMLLDRRVRVVACVATAEVVMGASSGDAPLESAGPLETEADREDSDTG